MTDDKQWELGATRLGEGTLGDDREQSPPPEQPSEDRETPREIPRIPPKLPKPRFRLPWHRRLGRSIKYLPLRIRLRLQWLKAKARERREKQSDK